jgi:tRNA A37 threonylcarbamoyladenosine dehydratase
MSTDEWSARTVKLIGQRAYETLRGARVAVFGVGGVGSFAAEALARAGVGEMLLVDGDCVAMSNINRQIHSLMSTLGLPKAEVMKARIEDINPYARVTAVNQFYPCECGIEWDFDYVIDAVDDVAAKVGIVLKCKERGVPVISSMGAGNKLHPEMFKIADIYETKVCPLARVMRRELKARNIKDLRVVYSEEPPVSGGYSEEPTVARRGLPGSISFVPSAAGLIIAGEVVRNIINRQ